MPRKPKATVDIMGNLEVMSRDTSLPEAVRAEAAREFVRLRAKDQPAPAPALTPAPTPAYSESEIREAFRKIEVGTEVRTEAKPKEQDPAPVTPAPVKSEISPEPAPRQQNSRWSIGGFEYIYLGFDQTNQLHILSPVKSGGIFPETIRVTEERLVGKRYAAPPRARGYETPEELRRRLDFEQAREAARWREQMCCGQFSGDPPGC
jgi:hypothetical protein